MSSDVVCFSHGIDLKPGAPRLPKSGGKDPEESFTD